MNTELCIPPQLMSAGRRAGVRSPDLSVVIPAVNERHNLELLLPALQDVINRLGIQAEILLVDGGSKDGTEDVARAHRAEVIRQTERGYGGALLAGFAASTAPFVLTMDADLSHRPVVVEQLWSQRHQAEVLIASRYVRGGQAAMGRFRRLLSKILNTTYRRALSLPTRDLSSGFRLYRRSILTGMELGSRDFDVLEEILIRAHNDGWRIHEVPFHYMARGSGRSHARLLKFGWAYLKTLVRMWRLRNSVAAADYDYRAFDSPIFLQRYWQRTRHDVILRHVNGRARVLDIGCGSSRIVLDMPNSIGLDLRHNKLRWLRSRHGGLVQGDCHLLPFPDQSFDTVVCSSVVEHIPDSPLVFSEMARVLQPGGTLVVGTPDYSRRLWRIIEWIYGKVLPDAYAHEHVTHFTRASLEQRLRACGLAILGHEYVGACEVIVTGRRVTASAVAERRGAAANAGGA